MARGPIEDVPDLDAALCHGTAGRAHLFNRLGHALGDEVLVEAARRYYRDTLARIGVALPDTPRLTTGTSGIGLALLAAITPEEPTWDRVFLTTLPDQQTLVGVLRPPLRLSMPPIT
jgi:hypothetical protein